MKYSISDLEQLSGVQTHTIRIWERRYHALTPMRSAGNTRFYDDDQLRRLLNIVGLSQTGLKISQVCALSDQEMNTLLDKEIDGLVSEAQQFEYYISKLLNFGFAYNEYDFNALITMCLKKYGMSTTYKNVIYPLLVRLGLMWRADHICPAQEHFVSNILKQKIYKAIDDLQVSLKSGFSWLLFLPEDEDHDIGLLYAHYLLKSLGQKVIFLGGRVPFESLKDAMKNNSIDRMLLFMVRSRPTPDADAYLKSISELYQEGTIHLAGNPKLIAELELPQNISWFQSIDEFERTIKDDQTCQLIQRA